MSKNITRASEISRSYTMAIDNYNSKTDCVVTVQEVQFLPVYKVQKRNRSTGKVVYERFYLNECDANLEFSNLMKEQTELF